MAFLKYLLIWLLLIISTNFAIAGSPQIQYQINGLSGDMLDNTQKRLAIDTKDSQPLTTDTVQKLFENGSQTILDAIKPYGYFSAQITAHTLVYKNKTWIAQYRVKLNEPVRITKLSIELVGPGSQDDHILKAKRHLKLKVGQTFNVPDYEDARNTLISAAQKRGYIKAKLQQDSIIIHLKKNSCTITLTLDTGVRYYFGPTTFAQNPISEKLLQGFKTYQQGEPFSATKLVKMQNELSGTGYYSSVNVEPQIEQAKGQQVPIDVGLTPAKRKQYQIGIGYGTATGARATAGINWKWVNKYGDKFSTHVIWSSVTKNLQMQYAIPSMRDPAHAQYVINGAYTTLNPRGGSSILKEAGFGYVYQRSNWQYNFGPNYLLERYKMKDEGFYRTAKIFMPSINMGWVSTKSDKIIVNNGASANILIQGGYKNLFSTVSFVQSEAKFKGIKTIWNDNRFIIRGDAGYTIIDDSNKLPLSLRYYTGGPTSVRGYSIDGIGPGRYLTVGSAEYQRRVVGNWYGAVFYDAGSAFDSYTEYWSQLKRSTGVGVVWQSPIGNVSLYVARALTTPGKPFRLEFSLGPDL